MQAHYTEGTLGKLPTVSITSTERARAERRIAAMRGELKGWLHFRLRLDDVARGKVKAKVPASVVARTLPLNRDWKHEQRLAVQLHALLSEVMDSSVLPDPDITKDPNVAVKLAQLAISGKLPNESQAPGAQGFLPVVFIWPVVIVVGLVMFTLMSKISSDAEVAKEKERIECIKIGACTDSGFWLKMGGAAVLAWVAWDKFGLKELAAKSRRKAS